MKELLGIAVASVAGLALMTFLSRRFSEPSALAPVGAFLDRILFPTEPE